jgi:hypothetical protein
VSSSPCRAEGSSAAGDAADASAVLEVARR